MEECRTDCDLPTDVALLSQRMEVVREEMGGLRRSMEIVADAVGKIALVEERISRHGETIDRAFKAIEKVATELRTELKEQAGRITKLERQALEARVIGHWIGIAAGAALGAGVTFGVTRLLGG